MAEALAAAIDGRYGAALDILEPLISRQAVTPSEAPMLEFVVRLSDRIAELAPPAEAARARKLAALAEAASQQPPLDQRQRLSPKRAAAAAVSDGEETREEVGEDGQDGEPDAHQN